MSRAFCDCLARSLTLLFALVEVCCPAIKSHNWRDHRKLLAAMCRRFQNRPGRSRLFKGALADVERLLDGRQPVTLRVTIVQPGISKARPTPQISAVLAAADEFVFAVRSRLKVIASA